MFSSRRLSLVVATVACLITASGAAADPLNTFIGVASPSLVTPSTTGSYTISLTSDPLSPDRGQRATIAAPAGFTVEPTSVQTATTAVAGSCDAATWPAEVTADQKIQLQRTGPDRNALCPGATLTVTFNAISAATEGAYSWTSELFNETSVAFTLAGPQPSVVVDGTGPTATIDGKPTNPSNDRGPSFVFSAGEPSSFECKLDGAAFTACSSPHTYASLADGDHTFAVRATDGAGNTGPEAGYAWRIDRDPPTATIGTKPNVLTNATSATFSFTANESGSFSCRLDGGASETCTSPRTYIGLGHGPHSFEVWATDQAGNTGPADSYTWTIDTDKPTATIGTKPNVLTNATSATFSFTANESGSFSCRLDGGASETCTSPRTYIDLGHGPHSFEVWATDQAGNTGPADSYTWTIDTVKPTATITSQPSDPSNNTSPTFSFTASESGSTFACSLDSAAFEVCSSPKSYSGLGNGQHSFEVRATDQGGNTGPETSYAWTIDTVPPAVPVITSRPANNTRSPSFSFTSSGGGTLCRLDTGVPAACTSPIGYSDLSDGPHTFGVKATDPAGNVSAETTYTWTIETRAPTAALISTPSGLSNSSAATFVFSADEPTSFDCKLDGGGFDPCTSPVTYHALGDGAHGFTVRARDAVGNFSSPVAYSWAIDTTAPETTLASAPKSGTSTSATFTFSATEGGTFECRLDGAPFALCSSPKSYGGLSRADHRFEVRAIDAAGNADATPSLHAWKVTAPAVKKTTSALLSPTPGARVTRPPLLTWRRVPRARYYNVQVYRGSRKVFSGWPTRTRLQLRQQWKYLGRTQRLTPGRYRWYVWPGYTNPRRYGALLGQSTFVVPRAVRR